MAKAINYTLAAYVQEVGGSQISCRIDATDTSGAKTLTFSDSKTVTLLASSGAVVIFPTGAGTLAAANLEVIAVPTYDAGSAIADRLLTFTRDTAAVEVRTLGAFSCDATLTVENADSAYGVSLELLFFVRNA